MPEALKLQWKRSVWVILMWNVATQNDIDLPSMSEYGWERLDGKLNIVGYAQKYHQGTGIHSKGIQMQDRMSDPQVQVPTARAPSETWTCMDVMHCKRTA